MATSNAKGCGLLFTPVVEIEQDVAQGVAEFSQSVDRACVRRRYPGALDEASLLEFPQSLAEDLVAELRHYRAQFPITQWLLFEIAEDDRFPLSAENGQRELGRVVE